MYHKKIKINKNLTIEICIYRKNYSEKTGYIKKWFYPFLYMQQDYYYCLGIENKIGIKIFFLH